MQRRGALISACGVLAALWAAIVVAAEAPPLRSRAEIEAVLAKAPAVAMPGKLRPLHVVLVADKKDHGPGEHDYPLWQKRWTTLLGGQAGCDAVPEPVTLFRATPAGEAKCAAAGAPQVKVSTAWQWPNAEQLRTADLVVFFCYRSGGAPRRWSPERVQELDAFLARGGGLVLIHSATYTLGDLKQPDGQRVVALSGLVFDQSIQVRHGAMSLRIAAPGHPICRGLPPVIQLVDEPYWPPTGDAKKVDVLATSEETVAKGSTKLKPQPMFWAYSRGKGRVFGCTPGHFNWTFDDPYFRLILLRGMAWASGESPYRFDSLTLRGVP
jgi:type 1 glutamine amidotransferase